MKSQKDKKRISFLVELDLPKGATIAEAKEYVLNAVSSWHGSYRPPGSYDDNDPGDPMFILNGEKVKVKRYAPN